MSSSSRFQEKSETVYVGYKQEDLHNYISSANTDINCDINGNSYNNINNEFNPKFVPTLKEGDQITPSQPFYGSNGISLQLNQNGNFFLQNKDSNILWTAGCNGTNTYFTLTDGYKCDLKNNIKDIENHNIINPYCQIESSGGLVCYGSTAKRETPLPYMSFGSVSSPNTYHDTKLIINGDYILKNKNISGNLTILDANNTIINSSINSDDYKELNNLNTLFDNAEKCNNTTSAQELIKQHNNHLATMELMYNANTAYNMQYLNAMNLTVGILITMGYGYYLYKKK